MSHHTVTYPGVVVLLSLAATACQNQPPKAAQAHVIDRKVYVVVAQHELAEGSRIQEGCLKARAVPSADMGTLKTLNALVLKAPKQVDQYFGKTITGRKAKGAVLTQEDLTSKPKLSMRVPNTLRGYMRGYTMRSGDLLGWNDAVQVGDEIDLHLLLTSDDVKEDKAMKVAVLFLQRVEVIDTQHSHQPTRLESMTLALSLAEANSMAVFSKNQLRMSLRHPNDKDVRQIRLSTPKNVMGNLESLHHDRHRKPRIHRHRGHQHKTSGANQHVHE